ncbi:MAG TPA: PQQ-dependent dehydrogenase, methanol/ethanol family [Terriglobia bacterium]|nr:PQQ-dependent dehydrogenase, methanol/ethanol family [Terriglobia bacterium]
MMKLACLFLCAGTLFAEERQVTFQDLKAADANNWLCYSGSYGSQRYSHLKQINTTNVQSLVPAWIFHVTKEERLESVPIVVEGVMYFTQAVGVVYAVDGQSGRLIWTYRYPFGKPSWPNRGAAVYQNRVYFTTQDAYLVALDARTGSFLWRSKIAEAKDGYNAPAAPLALNGRIVTGVAPGDFGMVGMLKAFDAATGKELWHWNVVPGPGEPGHNSWAGDSWKTGGGDTWLTGSYDPELNLIYWGVGNPAPDFNGDVRQGDNLYTECMVALDADTGKLKWFFQFTPHDTADWDAVEIPVLVDHIFDGEMRKLLVQADRNGFYYVLDRTNGKFLHGSPFVRSLNWATGLTAEGRPIRVPGIAPSVQGTRVCPSCTGATNWMSPAYDPDTGYFYLEAIEGCQTQIKASQNFKPGGFPFNGTGAVDIPDEPLQVYIRALELTTGKLVWEYKVIGSHDYGAGVLATAGGLLFAGSTEGSFMAFNARTGKVVWHFNSGQPISASPMTYSFNGKQYVAIAAGSDVMAFRLFEKSQ